MQKPFFFFFRLHVQVNLLNDAYSRLQTQKRKVRIILKELKPLTIKETFHEFLKKPQLKWTWKPSITANKLWQFQSLSVLICPIYLVP